MNPGVLIVGAGQAGVQVAASLREFGYDAPATLIGAESYLPYQRPPLSKSYLSLEAEPESLALRAENFYQPRNIRLIRGERVTEIDLERGQARTDAGSELRFERLALTTGARPRRLPITGADLTGVHYLRSIDDAHDLGRALRRARSVVVVGGGFIGLEVASAAIAAGRTVTVVEAASRLIPRAVAPVVSEFFLGAHARRGIVTRLDRTVVGIDGEEGAVRSVRIDDGTELPADLVLVGIGVVPRTEIAEKLGLDVRGAIVVDDRARTSDERVVAAGDVTLLPHPLAPGTLVRLESVQNAVDQARTAAATMAGLDKPYVQTPWFWSDQGDLKLQIAGLSTGHDHVTLRGNPESECFSALYYRTGQLIAADCINSASDFLAVRRALSKGATIPADQAGDESIPLKKMIVSR